MVRARPKTSVMNNLPRTDTAIALRARAGVGIVVTMWAVAVAPAVASIRIVTDAALAASSAAAVHGRVVQMEVRAEPGVDALYTYVTLDVLRSWPVTLPSRVVLKQLGGHVAGTELHIGGQARFEVGEEVFVFLDVRPRDGTLYVAGLEQGKWSIRDVVPSGSPAAVREPHLTFVPQPTVADRRALVDLEAMAQQIGGSGAAFVTSPPELELQRGALPTYAFFSTPARWHEADAGQPVYIDSQTGGHPQFPGGGTTQLSRAAAMWRDASSLNAQPGVLRGPRCRSDPAYDGRISVTYGDPCGEIGDQTNTLAIGGYSSTSADVRARGGLSFWKILRGIVVVDNAAHKFQNMSLGCYEQMLAHELGHAIGFDHSTAANAVMRGVISGCGGRTTSNPLSTDELTGLAIIYPRAAVPPPAAPQGFAASVAGNSLLASWTPVSGQVLEYILEAGTAPGAVELGTVSTGLQTSFAATVPPGRYYLRVRARNGSGVGPASTEVSVVVGTPGPPAPPQGFTATSAGSTVFLQWVAPVGGAPLGYQVEAGSRSGLADIAVFPVAGNAVTAAGVPPGVYYVRVRGVGAGVIGAPSNEVRLVVGAPSLPGSPVGLMWTLSAGRTVTLAWSPPASGEAPTGYLLEAGSAPGFADIVPVAVLGASTTLVVPGVPPGAYYVRVKAMTPAGAGVPSNEVVVIVQ